jgi:hypothetical protein
MTLSDTLEFIEVPEEVTLAAQMTVLFRIKGKTENIPDNRNIKISYEIKNLKIYPGKGLPVELHLTIAE